MLFAISLCPYTSLSFSFLRLYFVCSLFQQFFLLFWRLILLILRALHTVHGLLEYLGLYHLDLLVILALKYLTLFAGFCFRRCVCVFTLAAPLGRFLAHWHYSLPFLYAFSEWRQFGLDLIQSPMLGRVVLDSFLGGFRTSKGRIFLIDLTVVELPIRLSFKTHACAHIDYRYWIYYKRLDNRLILKPFFFVRY